MMSFWCDRFLPVVMAGATQSDTPSGSAVHAPTSAPSVRSEVKERESKLMAPSGADAEVSEKKDDRGDPFLSFVNQSIKKVVAIAIENKCTDSFIDCLVGFTITNKYGVQINGVKVVQYNKNPKRNSAFVKGGKFEMTTDIGQADDKNPFEIMVSADTFPACWTLFILRCHCVFKCAKCHKVGSALVVHAKAGQSNLIDCQIHHPDDESPTCDNCQVHESFYRAQSEKVRKRNLFNCYVCTEENINKKYKATLKCPGAGTHTDDICIHCFTLASSKCPQCRE